MMEGVAGRSVGFASRYRVTSQLDRVGESDVVCDAKPVEEMKSLNELLEAMQRILHNVSTSYPLNICDLLVPPVIQGVLATGLCEERSVVNRDDRHFRGRSSSFPSPSVLGPYNTSGGYIGSSDFDCNLVGVLHLT